MYFRYSDSGRGFPGLFPTCSDRICGDKQDLQTFFSVGYEFVLFGHVIGL
jgi:hypothetical protein